MNTLKKQYRDLEMRVMNELRGIVSESEEESKTFQNKAIQLKTPVENYTEIILSGDQLRFVCKDFQVYSIFTVPLETLIDIINEHRPEL